MTFAGENFAGAISHVRLNMDPKQRTVGAVIRVDNSAGNLQWIAFITAGEGVHNHHHAAPTSARLSHRWFEIDPGWWVIKAMTWLKLARVRLTELKFVKQPEPAKVS